MGKKVLEQMSKASGGRFFEVTKKETIDKIYAAIDEDCAANTAWATLRTNRTPRSVITSCNST